MPVDDNVMVDGRPSDIVIPCDPSSIFIILSPLLTSPMSVLWAQSELEKALYAPYDLESSFSLTRLLRS